MADCSGAACVHDGGINLFGFLGDEADLLALGGVTRRIAPMEGDRAQFQDAGQAALGGEILNSGFEARIRTDAPSMIATAGARAADAVEPPRADVRTAEMRDHAVSRAAARRPAIHAD